MSNKLKIFTLTIQDKTYVFVADYSYFMRYLVSCGKISFLKNYYHYHRPLPFKLDYRRAISYFLIYILYVLGERAYNTETGFYPISLRFRTLSEATSDLIYSSEFAQCSLEQKGIFLYCIYGGSIRDAMFSSDLRFSERLFKSGNWKEYHFVPQKNF